jgi:CYTH domain-containing protein/predicted ATPase
MTKDVTVTVIGITGGPSGGKSSLMKVLPKKLNNLGYGAIHVPEAATELMSSGCRPGVNIPIFGFQEVILGLQMGREDIYLGMAKKLDYEHVIMLCDRAVMDNFAYIDEVARKNLLEDTRLSPVLLRDARYDGIIFLRTAALGAEAFYTTENNPERKESLEEARAIDAKTLEAWLGHSHLHVIENVLEESFEDKLEKAFQAILAIVCDQEIERKYLVESTFDYTSIPVPYHVSDIEQVHLSPGLRVRKRGEGGVYIYTQTKKVPTESERRRGEEESFITSRVYRELAVQDDIIGVIHKKRICFVYDGQYFELDVFQDRNLVLIEIELVNEDTPVRLPEWLPVVREVTGEKDFKNEVLAGKKRRVE